MALKNHGLKKFIKKHLLKKHGLKKTVLKIMVLKNMVSKINGLKKSICEQFGIDFHSAYTLISSTRLFGALEKYAQH